MASRIVPVTSLGLALAGILFAACGGQPTGDTPPGSNGDDGPTTDGGAHLGDASASSDGGHPTKDASKGGDTGQGEASQGAPGDAGSGTACANPPCINVINGCPFPIWIHGEGQGATLVPDDAKLAPAGQAGNVQQYDVPASWPAARVNAYWEDPNGASSDPNAFDKVELTVSGGSMNYNITYVDYLALPVRMEAVGPSCSKSGGFDPRVQCALPVGEVLSGCPNGMLDGKRCLSAGNYCTTGGGSSAFCHALDSAVQTCEQQNPGTCGIAGQLGNGTANAYGCSGYFDSQPPNCSPASTTCHQDGNKWCAALNRGMLANPDSTDTSLYYKTAPFNAYAKWVHDTCPGIYAFPYDDYPSGAGQSGFRSCTADRLDVTFCPGG